MGSEVFLYAYGLVCLSMLVFNVVYSLHLRPRGRRLLRPAAGSDFTFLLYTAYAFLCFCM